MNKIKHLILAFKALNSFTRRRQILDYPPLKLWIETTSRCNLRCGSCLNRSLPDRNKKDMDISLYKDIIDQAGGIVYEVNLFHRGEPLLHPDIADMTAYASEKGIKTSIHTNATLLEKDLGREIIGAGLDYITFSLDTLDKKDYMKKRPGADLDTTLENIRQFIKSRDSMGRKKPRTTLLLMEDDGSDIIPVEQRKKVAEAFKGANPDRIVSRKPHNWGGLLDCKTQPGIKKHACTFPWYSLTIFSDGTAYPCPQDFMGAMPVGSLDKEPLLDIFNGAAIKEIREMFSSQAIKKKLPCSECDRIMRKTFLGIPLEYAVGFLKE